MERPVLYTSGGAIYGDTLSEYNTLVLGSTDIVIPSAAPKIYGVSLYQVLLRSESSTSERDCPPLIYVIVGTKVFSD